MPYSRIRFAGILSLLTIALSFGWAGTASGAPLQQGAIITADPNAPDSTSTDGLCSLREAIISANKDSSSPGDCVAGSGHDTIVLAAGATYTLTKSDNGKEDSSSSGDLDITGDLNIVGNGATITVSSGFRDRILHVIGGTVTIDEVTLSGGAPRGDGGAILNLANLTLRNSTLTQNVAGSDGGAIANQGTLMLANVTISGNRSANHGGGLSNSAGSTALNNVTVAYNIADEDNKQGGDGGGVARTAGVLTLSNTLLGENLDVSSTSGNSDCAGSISSAGYNLVQNVGSCSFSASGDLLGMNPQLRPLGDYGGTTQTHALNSGSPAIDAGSDGASGVACEATDQRGVSRPRGAACDIGAYEADPPVPPALIRAFTVSGATIVDGLVPGFPDSIFTLNIFLPTTCDPSPTLGEVATSLQIETDENGYFQADLAVAIVDGEFVSATITNSIGDESAASACIVAGPGNDSWPRALRLPLSGNSVSYEQILDTFGQSLWFKFTVEPGSQLIITLTDLPENYDLTVYKDIGAAYNQLTSTEDLERLTAEFAPSAFSPSAFSPSAFSPSAFSPSAFSPSAFSPSAFSPSAFSPSAFSPSAFSPSAFSPDAWSPSAFSPSAFSPSAFSPSAFSPSAFSPSAFSPSAFSAAQMQSLIGVSAFDGTAGEGLVLNTWNNSGDFYVRVRGREGAFSLEGPFLLGIVVQAGDCGTIDPALAQTSLSEGDNSYRTVILTDSGRIEGSNDEIATLLGQLDQLASRPEVHGVVVDLAYDSDIQAANNQADANPECPFAKNVVAEGIRKVIDLYRNFELKYVVLVGGDEVIPFFRHPDEALLGPEQQYVPPVLDNTASQASLRLNYVLSQEDYGAEFSISHGIDAIPIPNLAVGRLVETAVEATGMIDAYLSTSNGEVPTPTSSLATGYDFLQDAADAINNEFELGLGSGGQTDTLIAPNDISPEHEDSWTADELANSFLGSRHDLVFLAGHFSAASALAADFRTSLTTLDLLASPVNLTNSIIFSAGCHSGYNIVNAHGVPFVTFEPDWAQAFAQKKATFIGGTGYQYGDTEFIEYSERIYLEFARQLRAGTGAVSVGDALLASKQAYLANTPQLRGIHAKAFLEATLFGLPMLSVEMPEGRYTISTPPPAISPTLLVNDPPGSDLGLSTFDLRVTPVLTEHTAQLTNYDTEPDSTVVATYLSGPDGVVTNPVEPTLPLDLQNVSANNTVLRGVGFRGGSYSDTVNILPLTGAPTTEIRGVHTPFHSSVFYPVRPWSVNYLGALLDGSGITHLALTPAQFRSSTDDPERGTLRQFTSMEFQLYYSNFDAATNENGLSALAAPATIVSVSSAVSGTDVSFDAYVVDNPAAGIQEVWVTWTDISDPTDGTWQSVNLDQNEEDSTLWQTTVDFGQANPADVRYIVQAANGLGLVSMATNLGSYYIPGVNAGQGTPTSLALSVSPSGGADYGTQIAVSATLTETDGDAGIGGKVVTFYLGSVGRVALTDSDGTATASLPIAALPGENEVVALFSGGIEFAPSTTSSEFTIGKRNTQITLELADPPGGFASEEVLIRATLSEANPVGRRLGEHSLVFTASGNGGSHSTAVITDYLGRATLGELPLPPGDYTVSAYFGGSAHGLGFSHEDARYNPTFASISLTLTNTKPAGQDDAYELDEDTTLDVAGPGVLANDTDVDDQSLTAVLQSATSNGTLTLNADGSFTYVPESNFNGSDSFTYVANDGIDNSDIVTVSLTILPVPDNPVAVDDDSYTTDEDNPLGVAEPGVLHNDIDADGDAITAVLVDDVSNGELALNPDGSFTYAPNLNFNGQDSFTYQSVDPSGGISNIATVSITVIPVNDDPVCDTVTASPMFLWPPDVKMYAVTLSGWSDPDTGQTTELVITSVYQDEPLSRRFDAQLDPNSPNVVKLRADRNGESDGRVYHIYFTVSDGEGGQCGITFASNVMAQILIPVDHNESNVETIDDGPLYNSIPE